MADVIARATALKAKLAEAREARTRADAAREQAEARLAEILTANGATSVEDLRSRAALARTEADRLLTEAEAAFA